MYVSEVRRSISKYSSASMNWLFVEELRALLEKQDRKTDAQ